MATEQLTPADSLAATVETIRQMPDARQVSHCGQSFTTSPFAFYATCPVCGERVKLRAFGAVEEVEDVFDAVFEWVSRSPTASAYAAERIAEIAADAD